MAEQYKYKGKTYVKVDYRFLEEGDYFLGVDYNVYRASKAYPNAAKRHILKEYDKPAEPEVYTYKDVEYVKSGEHRRPELSEYFLSENGTDVHKCEYERDRIRHILIPKHKPVESWQRKGITYRLTGETRVPQQGEYYLAIKSGMNGYHSQKPCKAVDPVNEYPIVTSADMDKVYYHPTTDKHIPHKPTGEYRKPEVGEFFVNAADEHAYICTNANHRTYKKKRYHILELVEKPEIGEPAKPAIDMDKEYIRPFNNEAYKATGEYRIPAKGECYLAAGQHVYCSKGAVKQRMQILKSTIPFEGGEAHSGTMKLQGTVTGRTSGNHATQSLAPQSVKKVVWEGKTYIRTGEIRLPKDGEYFYDDCRCNGEVVLASHNFTSTEYEICLLVDYPETTIEHADLSALEDRILDNMYDQHGMPGIGKTAAQVGTTMHAAMEEALFTGKSGLMAEIAKDYGLSIKNINLNNITETKENPMLRVTTREEINGTLAEDFSNDRLITMIEEGEAELARLKAIKVESKAITKQIADLNKGIKAVVKILDARK